MADLNFDAAVDAAAAVVDSLVSVYIVVVDAVPTLKHDAPPSAAASSTQPSPFPTGGNIDIDVAVDDFFGGGGIGCGCRGIGLCDARVRGWMSSWLVQVGSFYS